MGQTSGPLHARLIPANITSGAMLTALTPDRLNWSMHTCKLKLFVELSTSGLRTLEIRKFPPLLNHAVCYTGFAANWRFSLKSGPLAFEPVPTAALAPTK